MGSEEVTAKPPKVQKLLDHANDCLSRYDLEAALKFYEKAVSLSPDDTELLDASGELCLEVGRSEDALNLLTRSVQLQPDSNAAKYMNLGQLMSGPDALRHFEQGIVMLKKELEGAKEEEEAMGIRRRLASGYVSMTEIHMTDLCDEEGAEQRCEELLGLATQADPQSVEAWSQAASFKLCQCKNDEAKKHTYKALGICNKLEEAEKPSLLVRVGIVKLLIELEQLDEAEEFGRGLLAVDDQ